MATSLGFSVSVVIPTYNDGEYLTISVGSVLAQSCPVKEIIVVDDGSETPLAGEAVEKLCSEGAPIKYIRQENAGPSAARNRGLREAEGDYVAFLDADDSWFEDFVLYKCKMLESLPVAEKYAGVFNSFVVSDSGEVRAFSEVDGYPDRSMIGKENGFPGGAPAYLFNRKALLSVSGFDEELVINEDFDLILRLLHAGYKIRGDSRPAFSRNIRSGSLTRTADFDGVLKKTLAFLGKAGAESLLPANEVKARTKLAFLSAIKQALLAGRFTYVLSYCFLIMCPSKLLLSAVRKGRLYDIK